MKFIKRLKNEILHKIFYFRNEKEAVKEIIIKLENKELNELIYNFSNYVIDCDDEYVYFNFSKMVKRDREIFKEYLEKMKPKVIIQKPIIYKIRVKE